MGANNANDFLRRFVRAAGMGKSRMFWLTFMVSLCVLTIVQGSVIVQLLDEGMIVRTRCKYLQSIILLY